MQSAQSRAIPAQHTQDLTCRRCQVLSIYCQDRLVIQKLSSICFPAEQNTHDFAKTFVSLSITKSEEH